MKTDKITENTVRQPGPWTTVKTVLETVTFDWDRSQSANKASVLVYILRSSQIPLSLFEIKMAASRTRRSISTIGLINRASNTQSEICKPKKYVHRKNHVSVDQEDLHFSPLPTCTEVFDFTASFDTVNQIVLWSIIFFIFSECKKILRQICFVHTWAAVMSWGVILSTSPDVNRTCSTRWSEAGSRAGGSPSFPAFIA